MKVIEEKKLNKFQPVSIPRNGDLFARYGRRTPREPKGGMVSEIGQNKLDVMANAMSMLDSELEKAKNPSK